MKIAFYAAAAVIFSFFLSGCVSYSYEGEALPPTENVTVYRNADKIERKYKVIGQAEVSGNYQDVSWERMHDKLISKAEDNGADAVLITARQVVRKGEAVAPVPLVNTMEATGAENTYSLNQLQKDFSGGYGQAFSSGEPAGVQTPEYKRIIKAEFIKFESPSDAKK